MEAGGAPQGMTEEDSVQLMLLGPTRPLPFFVDLPPAKLEDRKMFVTTFNCGECTLNMIADYIGDWIPKDVDVYVRLQGAGPVVCVCVHEGELQGRFSQDTDTTHAGDRGPGVHDSAGAQAGHSRPRGARQVHVVRLGVCMLMV